MAGKSYTFDSRLQPMRSGYKLDDITVKCRQHPAKLAMPASLNTVAVQRTQDSKVNAEIAKMAKFVATAEQYGTPVGELKPAEREKRAYIFGKIWASPADKARFVQSLRSAGARTRRGN